MAFQNIKKLFNSPAFMDEPDPVKQFILGNTGIGAGLSQRGGSNNQLHPVAFYSHHSSIGDSEILAVKLALGETGRQGKAAFTG